MSNNKLFDNQYNNENMISEIGEGAPIKEILDMKLYGCVHALREFFGRSHNVCEQKARDPRANIINLGMHRSYNIGDEVEEMFELLEVCRRAGCVQHVQEKQTYDGREESGIMIDIDRYQETSKDELGMPTISKFINAIVRVLASIVDLTDPFHIFIIRKEKPEYIDAVEKFGKTCYKDGLHVLIPEIWISREAKLYLHKLLRERMCEIFAKVPDGLQSREEMLDMGAARNGVFFVGSAKLGKETAYPLYYATRVEYSTDGPIYSNIDVDALRAGEVRGVPGVSKINLVYELSLTRMMSKISGAPTWLRKRAYTVSEEVGQKAAVVILAPQDISEMDELENSVNITCASDAEAAFLRKILSLLSSEYYDVYDKWLCVLFAVANTNSNYKEIARLFSMRSKKYSAGDFDKFWNDAVNGRYRGSARNLSIRSIIYWVQECGPDAYKAIREDYFYNKFCRLIYQYDGQLEHDHVAEVLHAMWKHKFVCVNDGDKKTCEHWYEFIMPGDDSIDGAIYKWRRDDRPVALENFISTKFQNLYSKILVDVKKRIELAKPANEMHAKYWVGVEKKIKESRRKLGNSGYIDGVVKRCAIKFRQREFLHELDRDVSVIGVRNGILYTGGDNIELIARPHEYIVSKYINVAYIPTGMKNHEVSELMNIFSACVVERDALEFLLYHGATAFLGEPCGFLVQLVGGGANGKSFFMYMINNTLGEHYSCNLSVKLFTEPLDGGADKPNPALMKFKGARWSYCEETKENDILMSQNLKVLCSASAKITGRKLFADQDEFKITGNIVLATNFTLKLTASDYGTLRRIKVYNFKVKFKEGLEKETEYEKRANSEYINKYTNDPIYKTAMLSILLYYFNNLKKLYGGKLDRVPHPTIITETEKFRDENDHINKFINQFMVRVKKTVEPLYLQEIAHKYREWYDKNVSSRVKAYFDTAAIVMKLEDSKLTPDLVRDPNTGLKFLKNWVMRDHIGQEILDDNPTEEIIL